MKTWQCAFCGRQEENEWSAPSGWLSLRDPGDILVCSGDCAAALISAIKAKEYREWCTS